MSMIRKQVYIEAEQDRKLKLLAKRRGTSEAELIRRGIELVEQEFESEDVQRRDAGERLIRMLRERAAAFPEGGGIKQWTRDDAYDDERNTRLLR